jgi:lipoprotein-anchoring transpeptidase ErfK/SrfK
MVRVLAVLAIIGLAVWGVFASGLVRLGGSGPVAPTPAARQAPPPVASRAATPGPSYPSDDQALLRPEGQPERRPVMQAQVVLERLGFSSGVVDGREGPSFAGAVRGFQQANGLGTTGRLDAPTRAALARWDRIPSTRNIQISAEFARGPFIEIPDDAQDQARLSALGYASLAEKLAERFHTTPDTIRALNPGADLAAGARVEVPNVGNDRIAPGAPAERGWAGTLASLGVASDQPRAETIVVDKSDGLLMAYDGAGKLIAQFPATMGSAHDPLPIGEWRIRGTAFNPDFHYNPALFWDVSDREESVTLPPGPNSPVGVVWIDLSREHYGIHGTPEPQSIGRTQSHGCIRLTNWDAARLAQMVRPGVAATFRP